MSEEFNDESDREAVFFLSLSTTHTLVFGVLIPFARCLRCALDTEWVSQTLPSRLRESIRGVSGLV